MLAGDHEHKARYRATLRPEVVTFFSNHNTLSTSAIHIRVTETASWGTHKAHAYLATSVTASHRRPRPCGPSNSSQAGTTHSASDAI